MRVRVSRRLPEATERVLRSEFDAELSTDDRQLTEAELGRLAEGADVLVCTVTDPVTERVIRAGGDRLALIANFGVGVDHIALDAARRLGIFVTNTPGVLTEATAELAVTLMLMTARRAAEGERLARSGRWTGWAPTQLVGHTLMGRTLGIVGMGRIGAATARRAVRGLGMQVQYFSRSAAHATDVPARRVPTLRDLVRGVDVLSLHAPLTPATEGMIDADILGHMHEGAILINTARGRLVDEEALADALERGALAGAGLDVHQEEPDVNRRLRALEQVVLLPHLGSATKEARDGMGDKVVASIRAFAAGATPPDLVAGG